MNYGLYLSASGALVNMYRQDVYANNLANVETVGFKPDIPMTTQRAPASVEDGLRPDAADQLLNKLGGGVFAGPQRIDFSPGAMNLTGNPLDAALADGQSFFAVEHTDRVTGAVSTRLTRDGRFTVNQRGQLITQAGDVVLGRGGQPITVPEGDQPEIGKHGRVLVRDEVAGHLQVIRVNDPGMLTRHGQNQFSLPAGAGTTEPAEPDVKFGFVEASGADPVMALMHMINATKVAMGNARMIQYQDLLMDRAVNTLGRVA